MKQRWPKHKLNEVAELCLGKMLDKNKNKGELHPYLGNIHVRWGSFDLDNLPEMRFENHEHERYGLKYGDLVVCEGGEPGRCALWKDQVPNMKIQKALHRVRPHACLDSRYLLYWFLEAGQRTYFDQFFTGATIKHLPGEKLAMVEVDVPPLPIQNHIADILSAYDELIENSRRRIKILEQMARNLYREWFVSFRFPNHTKTPLVDSPLGKIPKGWECIQLSNVINVTHGYAFQGGDFSDEPTSRILTTPGNFKIGGGIKYDKLKFYKEDAPLKSNYVFEPMDLILTMTDLSKTGDTLGFPAFVPKLKNFIFLHNQRIGRVVPVGKFFPKHFLYCLFCDDRYRHHIVAGATGMAVKHTSPTRILSYAAALPMTGNLIDSFEKHVRPIYQEVSTIIEKLENLRKTRDLLLPRLLSGQINVN